MSGEEWRPIVGFEDLYSVSDLGRIRSKWGRSQERILKATPNKAGYLSVTLYAPGMTRQRFVHCLVLRAFVGEPPPGMETRHLNGDPADNRLVNLAYGTHSENMRDRVAHGTDPHARRTECKNGHPYAADTTQMNGTKRVCLVCTRERGRARSRGSRAAYYREYRARKSEQATS